MPQIPIPQGANIGSDSWSPDFQAGGLLTPASNDRTPVNPIDIANQQAQLQSQNALRQAQTISAAADAQAKQRSFQLSMLNGVMSLPPEQQADALAKVVPMMNRMGPTQFDANMSPAMAKMYMMSNVPTEHVPEYALNSQMVDMGRALQERLSGQQPTTGGASQTQGTPMPANGIISGATAPVPQGGGQPIDTATLEQMALLPRYREGAATINEIQNSSPQGQANIVRAKNQAEQGTAANKGAIQSSEGYKQVEQSLDALEDVIKHPDLPQSRYFVPAKAQADLAQNLGGTTIGKALGYDNQNAANDFNNFTRLNESQSIKAIQSMADTGEIKMTKTLENMVNRGYLVDPNASQASKLEQAQIARAELKNSMIAAQNVNAKMNGGETQPYAAPLQSEGQQGTPMPKNGQIKAQNALPKLIPNQTIYKGHIYIGGDPSKPSSWQSAINGS